MEDFRKQMDKRFLEQFKDKIQLYLKSKGFKNSEFIRANMDTVSGLYVENSIEKGGPKMQCRPAKSDKPAELMIDKIFAELDEEGNPIGINKNLRKLIMTQLTHELIHSGALFDGYTGIKSTDQNRGLNEGMTQMFTEKIWGYTVSPNSDSGYKDFKKIAKILDVTFGEDISIDAYFNHSNALANACNGLSQDSRFYSDINRYLTSTYYMNKSNLKAVYTVPKDAKDVYYGTIMQPIREKMLDFVYEKVCAEIVIPKLKTMSKDKQRKIFA